MTHLKEEDREGHRRKKNSRYFSRKTHFFSVSWTAINLSYNQLFFVNQHSQQSDG